MCYDVRLKMKPVIIIIAIPILCLALLGISGVLPGGDGIVVSKELDDGTQILVTQKYSGIGEPYIVSLYFKEPKSKWGWCYLDHQDTQWRNSRIEYDEQSKVVSIWKGSTLRGQWNRKTNVYNRPDVQDWASEAPQEYRNPPFTK